MLLFGSEELRSINTSTNWMILYALYICVCVYTHTHTHTHGRYLGLMIYHQVYISVNHVFLFFWYHVFDLTHICICYSNVLSLQISYVEILMHKVMVLRGGANIRIIGVPEEEDKKKGHEKILEEIIAENFPKMG